MGPNIFIDPDHRLTETARTIEIAIFSRTTGSIVYNWSTQPKQRMNFKISKKIDFIHKLHGRQKPFVEK